MAAFIVSDILVFFLNNIFINLENILHANNAFWNLPPHSSLQQLLIVNSLLWRKTDSSFPRSYQLSTMPQSGSGAHELLPPLALIKKDLEAAFLPLISGRRVWEVLVLLLWTYRILQWSHLAPSNFWLKPFYSYSNLFRGIDLFKLFILSCSNCSRPYAFRNTSIPSRFSNLVE